jgi:hypothetical protein
VLLSTFQELSNSDLLLMNVSMNNQFKVDIYRYFRLVKFEYKISLAYLMVGLLWILFSDEALALLISDPVLLTKFQTYKGSFYILVTASLLFFMAKNMLGNSKSNRRCLKSCSTPFLIALSLPIPTVKWSWSTKAQSKPSDRKRTAGQNHRNALRKRRQL